MVDELFLIKGEKMIVFISILLEILATILHTVNGVIIGVATISEFNVFGLFLTIICMCFGCRHFCRCIDKITLVRKIMKEINEEGEK